MGVSTVLVLRTAFWFSAKYNISNVGQRQILFVSEHAAFELCHYPLLPSMPTILFKNMHISCHSKIKSLTLINEILLSD